MEPHLEIIKVLCAFTVCLHQVYRLKLWTPKCIRSIWIIGLGFQSEPRDIIYIRALSYIHYVQPQIKVTTIQSPCLFNLYAEYIMRNAGLQEAQAGIKIAGRNINNLRYADDTTLMAESEEELKSFLMKVKEEMKKLA